MIEGDEKNCNYHNYGRLELSRIFSWVIIIQSDQSEYVPRRALLKGQFSCCVQWSYTVTQKQLPIQNTKYDKTSNVNSQEFQPKRSAAAVAEQRIRNIADNENQ